MEISVTNIRSANSDEWDRIWRECDYSTYFHSREWAEIWNVYTKGKMSPEPIMVEFSDSKRALLPLSTFKKYKGFIRDYISSPAGTFGGWISSDELNILHTKLLIEYLTKLSNLIWRINPYDALLSNVFKLGGDIVKDDETHILNLDRGFDAIYKDWTKGHSSAVHKARKAGVNIKPASLIFDWQSYFKVYEDSLRRWGDKASSRYGWEIFYEMFQRNSSNIKLWLAIYQDKVVAGALCFYAKKHLVYWHGAALEEYFNLRPVNLLVYEIIKDACDKGYAWFDFNPSGGHEGVKAFKKNFGAEPLPCPVVKIETLWKKLFVKVLLIAIKWIR